MAFRNLGFPSALWRGLNLKFPWMDLFYQPFGFYLFVGLLLFGLGFYKDQDWKVIPERLCYMFCFKHLFYWIVIFTTLKHGSFSLKWKLKGKCHSDPLIGFECVHFPFKPSIFQSKTTISDRSAICSSRVDLYNSRVGIRIVFLL